MDGIFELEDLIAQRGHTSGSIVTGPYASNTIVSQANRPMLASKSATQRDFIKMISKIVMLSLKDLNVEFIPDDGKPIKIDSQESIDHPIITYKTVRRSALLEIKPRVRESIQEFDVNDGTERVGEIYGQKFKSIIQFNIFASVNDLAEEVMERFEELMFTYIAYFKQNGVSEILFSEQLTDSAYDSFRQNLSIRSIQYHVETEKLIPQFKEKINKLEITNN